MGCVCAVVRVACCVCACVILWLRFVCLYACVPCGCVLA